MTAALRRRAEVSAKCRAFLDGLDAWQDNVGRLPQHTSQVARLMSLFRPLGERLEQRTAGAHPPKLAEVLLLFRVWAFYRQKLDQRFVPGQREFLEIADDLAYRWWVPARAAAVQAARSARYAKEPPLVFLNGDVSPFTVTRKLGFQAEDAYGLPERGLEWSAKVLSQAPVPVIAVPYFAARHIPDLMVIAHEVGHNVEDDFDLTADLNEAVAKSLLAAQNGKSAERAGAWRAWREEVFADLWGVLVAGPGFVDALVDFITDDASPLAHELASDRSRYPTVWLRAELLFTALEALGLGAQAAARRAAFIAQYPVHAMVEYVSDIPTVVRALLDCEPRSFGASVRQVSGFNAPAELQNEEAAHSIAQGRRRSALHTGSLAKAMCLAFFERPQAISGNERSQKLWEQLGQSVQNSVRSSEKSIDPAEIARFDANAVESLLGELSPPGGDEPPG